MKGKNEVKESKPKVGLPFYRVLAL
jgi:hypothetical protein